MISSIRLQNYRNHKDTEIEFGRLTALVGPNSAGKSNVLESIRCLTSFSLPDEKFASIFSGAHDPDVVVRDGESFFALELEGAIPEEWHLRIQFTMEPRQENERASAEDDLIPVLSGNWQFGGESGKIEGFGTRVLDGFAGRKLIQQLGGATYLKAIPEYLSDPSTPQEVPPTLHKNGKGLASVISYLMTTEPDRFARLVHQLQEIVPEVEGLRIRPKVPSGKRGEEEKAGRLDELLYDMRSGSGLPAHSVSEGTLVATGLLVTLIGNEKSAPQFLMIDDLERGLHPKAQRELVGVLRKILEQRPNLQIVFTTHSPYIIDELDPEETWLLNTDAEGVAHTRRLSDHPNAARSLQVLTTGEFWSAEGEDWVVESSDSNETSTSPSVE